MQVWKFLANVLVPSVVAAFVLNSCLSAGRVGAAEEQLLEIEQEQTWTREAFRQMLGAQKSATSVGLMLVPDGVGFFTSITSRYIARVSCIYEATSPSSIAALVDEISGSVSPIPEASIFPYEKRIGIIFYKGNDVSATLYFIRGKFPDGQEKVLEVVDGKQGVLQADFEFKDRLGKWSQRSDVTFVQVPEVLVGNLGSSPAVCDQTPKPVQN